MKKFLTCIIVTCLCYLAMLPVTCKAQTWVTIPDANFAHYLDSIIPAAMSGNQMNTSSTLVTTTTHTIVVNGKGIANLSGIQYFNSLTYLYCPNNSLLSLPALPNSLITLICSGNQLNSLPALPNSMTTLVCGGNALTSLPTLPNSLGNLQCWYNKLTSLPTLPHLLGDLGCQNNLLTSLPTLPD